jgi:hypothetical protein
MLNLAQDWQRLALCDFADARADVARPRGLNVNDFSPDRHDVDDA